jgi:hypothetical protein
MSGYWQTCFVMLFPTEHTELIHRLLPERRIGWEVIDGNVSVYRFVAGAWELLSEEDGRELLAALSIIPVGSGRGQVVIDNFANGHEFPARGSSGA